jgi:hypothetical protein
MGTMLGNYFPVGGNSHPGDFRNWWVIKDNKLIIGQ